MYANIFIYLIHKHTNDNHSMILMRATVNKCVMKRDLDPVMEIFLLLVSVYSNICDIGMEKSFAFKALQKI